MLRATLAAAKPLHPRWQSKTIGGVRTRLYNQFSSTMDSSGPSKTSTIQDATQKTSLFDLKEWKNELLQKIKNMDGALENRLSNPEDYIYSSAIQVLTAKECVDAAYTVAFLAGKVLDKATYEMLIKLMIEQDLDASFVLWTSYLMKLSGLNITPKILGAMNSLKKSKRTNLREFDSVLKKLAESAETLPNSRQGSSQKHIKGWLGAPLKGSLAVDPVGTLQDVSGTETKQPEGAVTETTAMDYEGFKAQMTTSKSARNRPSAQDSQGGKNQTPSPAEMIYFPQSAEDPVQIQLAGLKKGASTAEIEKKITSELNKYDGKIQGNLVTSYKALREGELATGATNFFEGMKKFENLLSQTKMVLITPKAFHVRDGEGNILFTVEDIEEDDEYFSEDEFNSEGEFDQSEDENNNGKNKPKACADLSILAFLEEQQQHGLLQRHSSQSRPVRANY